MWTDSWNSGVPSDQTIVAEIAEFIRKFKRDFRERIDSFIPVGAIFEWPTETCPDGFAESDGTSLAVASYPELFAKYGYKFGGSGANFNIIDMRGIFPRAFPGDETGIDLDADNAVSCNGDVSGTAITNISGLAGCPRIGATITGTGVLADTTITAFPSFDSEGIPTAITISQAATTGTDIDFTIDNKINGSYGYDANKTHSHGYVSGEGYPDYNAGYLFSAYRAPGVSTDTALSGGSESRPKNTSIMYVVRTKTFNTATFTNTWDETVPEDDVLDAVSEAGKVDNLIRQLRLDIRERILKFFPVGLVMKWTSDLMPPGFMECKPGTSLLRSEYPVLYGVIGTTYGAEDSTHFSLPPYSGRFLRGWNHGKSSGLYDPDAATRTAVTATGATMTAGDHVGTEQEDENKSHLHSYLNLYWFAAGTWILVGAGIHNEIDADTESVGTENRPKNVNAKYIIRTDGMDVIGDDYDYIRAWYEDYPVDTTRMGRIALELRKLKKDIEERIYNMFAPGLFIWWPGDDTPEGYADMDGSELSRTTYSTLFEWIGDMYGPGDGDTTFNLPNIQGFFVRAQDSGSGIDEGTRTERPDGLGGDYNGTFEDDDILAHVHVYKKHERALASLGYLYGANTNDIDETTSNSPARTVDGHPKNIYLRPLIRTQAI